MVSRSREEVAEDPFAAIGCDEVVPIGSGGSSVVYRARQRAFDRLIALKVLSQPVADERSRRRFERELALAGRLTGHPNVVTVFASGFFGDGRAYVQMEYCPGGSLADRLAAQGPLPVQDVVSIGIKLAGVLELARREGIVHRDVKPANVLVTRFGEPALADFGIAIVSGEMTGTTQALTPVHAAPEVLESREAGPWADQWSLGSTLLTLLAGRAPFASGDDNESLLTGMLRILNDPVPAVPRADVPESLRAVLERAMAKRAADRWPTPADLGRALQDVERAEGWPVTTLPTEEVSEARYTPAGAQPGTEGPAPRSPAGAPTGDVGPPGTGLDPRTTYAVPGRPAPTPAGGEEGHTIPWQRGASPAPAAPAAPGPSPSAPAGPAPASGPQPAGGRPSGVTPPGDAGEATEHWVRKRSAPPQVGVSPTPAPPSSARRWWLVGGGITAVVAVIAVVAILVGTHGSRPTTASSTTRTLPTENPAQLLPADLRITNEAGNAVTLQWQETVSGLQYVVQARNQLTGEVTNQFPNTTQYTFSGLTPGVSYCFAVGTVQASGAVFGPDTPCTAGAHAGGPPSSAPAGTG